MLTRREAEALIEDCGPEVSALRALAEHWDMAGHWNENAALVSFPRTPDAFAVLMPMRTDAPPTVAPDWAGCLSA